MSETASDLITTLRTSDLEECGQAVADRLEETGFDGDDLADFRELLEGVWWSRQPDRSGLEGTAAMVRRVAQHAMAHDLLVPVLGYVRRVCEEAWELSWDHTPIERVIAALQLPDTRRALTADEQAAQASLTLLLSQIHVESALCVGDPALVADQASTGCDSAATAGELARAAHDPAVQEWLGEIAEDVHEQLAAISSAGLAADRVFSGGTSKTGTTLEEAIERLYRAETHRYEDDANTASELRAHRVALESLREASGAPWLRVDEGIISHIFPFGIGGVEPAHLVEEIKRHAEFWSLGGQRLGNRPTSLLLIDDIWRGEDPLKRRYEGTQLDLPDVLVQVGQTVHRLNANIVISQIGNHHLKLSLDLTDALPHQVASAQMLSMPEYGNLTELGGAVRFDAETSRTWSRLVDLVTACLRDVVGHLRRDGHAPRLSFRPGMFHVITQVHRASALAGGSPDDAQPLSTPAELAGLFGAGVLQGPLPSGVGSIADWAVGQPPPPTIIPTAIAVDTQIALTANHTLIASFRAPNFMICSVRAAVDFSVSLEGMFAAWQDELTLFQSQLRAHMLAYPNAKSLEEAEHHQAERVFNELQEQHLALRRFANAARTSLLFIASPALVSSPVVRQTLTALLEANPVWAQRSEFTESAGQALSERYEEIIGGWTTRRAAVQETRNRVMVETLLAVVAGIGISGIASLMQAGFGLSGWWDTIWLVAAVVMTAVLIGVLAYRWTRATRRPRKRTSRERRTADHRT